MDLDQLLTMLSEEHGIDVRDLQAKAAKADDAAALTNALSDAGLLKLSNGDEVSADDVIGAITEVAQNNVELSSRLEVIEREKVELEVDKLVETGFIKPADKDAMLELRLSNEELFNKLVPEKPVVEFASKEHGIVPSDPGGHQIDIDSEVERYSDLANA